MPEEDKTEVEQINVEIKEVLARHPGFGLTAEPFINPEGRILAKPSLIKVVKEETESALEA